MIIHLLSPNYNRRSSEPGMGAKGKMPALKTFCWGYRVFLISEKAGKLLLCKYKVELKRPKS